MKKEDLISQIKRKKSFLCIGLDTDINKIPKFLLDTDDPIFEFNKKIIDATNSYCVAYKPNIAFYESLGLNGWKALEKTIDAEILYAPKQGFNAPAEEWCIEAKEDVFREIKRYCANTGTLDYDGIRSLCDDKPRHLWRFYVLARWHFLTFHSCDKLH